jgi:cell division protease FtsH
MGRKETEESIDAKVSHTRFEDIVGHKQVKQRLKAIIKIFTNPKIVEDFKISPPKGMLIYGPPSVGKRMLARAFAKEAGVKYFEISGSKLFDTTYIKKVYKKALEIAPSIVILENIDIKGIYQGAITNISFSDLAKELENLPQKEGKYVFTIATATEFEEIDPVLFTPNKLDFLVEVSKLDMEARKFFIEKILEKPNDGKIDIKRIVRYITGLGAADLERLGRMAALAAIEQGKKVITEEILIEQINIIKYGHKLENQMIKNLELEMTMTAYHEAAHAVLSYLLLPDVKIEQITISPRSKTLGFVSYNEQDQVATVTKEEIFHDICVLMAGQTAKIKKAGKKAIDTGAVDDLYQASFQAYNAIAVLGMDKELGFININAVTSSDLYFLSENIEKRFLKWIHEAQKITAKLIDEHWKEIDTLAKVLIEKEVVESDELVKIVGKQKKHSVLPATL